MNDIIHTAMRILKITCVEYEPPYIQMKALTFLLHIIPNIQKYIIIIF